VRFVNAVEDKYAFFPMMKWYYTRETIASANNQDAIEKYVDNIYHLLENGKLLGSIAYDENIPVGIVIYRIDREKEETSYSVLPGYGSIVNIGLIDAYRHRGLGNEIVAYVESVLKEKGVKNMYVCSSGPSDKFWKENKFSFNGKASPSGQSILEKEI